jgi:hypothetical protein
MARAIVTEILLLTGFAPKSALRLAGVAHLRASLKDGERVADFPWFTSDSGSAGWGPDTQN